MSQEAQDPSPATTVENELTEAELDSASGGQKQSSGSATSLTNSAQQYVHNVVSNVTTGFTNSGAPSISFQFSE